MISQQVSIFDHNCQNTACLSRRVSSLETTKRLNDATTYRAVCADCGAITEFETLSDYRFIFASSPTETSE